MSLLSPSAYAHFVLLSLRFLFFCSLITHFVLLCLCLFAYALKIAMMSHARCAGCSSAPFRCRRLFVSRGARRRRRASGILMRWRHGTRDRDDERAARPALCADAALLAEGHDAADCCPSAHDEISPPARSAAAGFSSASARRRAFSARTPPPPPSRRRLPACRRLPRWRRLLSPPPRCHASAPLAPRRLRRQRKRRQCTHAYACCMLILLRARIRAKARFYSREEYARAMAALPHLLRAAAAHTKRSSSAAFLPSPPSFFFDKYNIDSTGLLMLMGNIFTHEEDICSCLLMLMLIEGGERKEGAPPFCLPLRA